MTDSTQFEAIPTVTVQTLRLLADNVWMTQAKK
jgi:hypothetical protein